MSSATGNRGASLTESKAIHYSDEPISVSKTTGKRGSVVYHASYITGVELYSEKHDKTFFRDESHGKVIHWETVGPKGSEHWTLHQIWNAAEKAAKKVNEIPGRVSEIALPYELCQGDMEEAKRLARGHCLWLRDTHGGVYTWAMHEPNPEAKGEGAKNFHFHIVETDRRVTVGKNGEPVFGKKINEFRRDKHPTIPNTTLSVETLKQRRAAWMKRANRALEKGGHNTRVDLRSNEVKAAEKGEAPKIASLHRGPKLNNMIRKHQAATAQAIANGKPIPKAPKRVQAFFDFEEKREAANMAEKSYWEATKAAAKSAGNAIAPKVADFEKKAKKKAWEHATSIPKSAIITPAQHKEMERIAKEEEKAAKKAKREDEKAWKAKEREEEKRIEEEERAADQREREEAAAEREKENWEKQEQRKSKQFWDQRAREQRAWERKQRAKDRSR